MIKSAIVLPSHGSHPQTLIKTLKSIKAQSIPPNEVIIVENGKKALRTEQLASQFEVDYYHVEQPGANNARNVGVELCDSDFVIFTDDDCVLDPNFVFNHMQANSKYDPCIIGGKVNLEFEVDPEEWLYEPFRKMLSELDWEKEFEVLSGTIDISKTNHYLVTANLSCSRKLFEMVGGFDPEMGYREGQLTANDENSFVDTVRAHNFRVMYSSDCIVKHQIPEERTKLEYFLKRYHGQGIADAALLHKHTSLSLSGDLRESLLIGTLGSDYTTKHMKKLLKRAKKDLSEDSFNTFLTNLLVCKVQYGIGAIEYSSTV